MGQIGLVVIARLCPHFFDKQSTYLFLSDVYCRQHDVAGTLVHQLQDALTEVGLYHVYAMAFEVGVHFAFLCQHRFALHHLFHPVLLQYAKHD